MQSLIASTKPASRSSLVRQMVEQAQAVRVDLLSGSAGRLNRIAKSLASTVGREVLPEEAADVVAQAAVCAAPILAAGDAKKAFLWLNEQLACWEREAMERAQLLGAEHSVFPTFDQKSAEVAHLFEHFLHRYTPKGRKRGGVFFTPQPIADSIVHRVDRLLRGEFSLTDGLADESVTILDPACGTGVFLLSAINHLTDGGKIETVLSRLIGVEILPAAAFLAKLNIAIKLAKTGCDFQQGAGIKIVIGDALSPNLQSEIRNPQSAVPVIIGNPPFSSLSTTTNEWIARLVRGDDDVRGYVRANGQRLAERKTWLHDDYVKFIRLAQWHIEQAGCGIVGLVTNHGFLDNATFRLMRQELLRVFPRIEIVDLHGNRKKHEIAPDGGRDENVFGLDQGVAITIFCRPRNVSPGPSKISVNSAERWGSRASKLAAISRLSLSEGDVVQPQAPDWLFVPSWQAKAHPEYDAAWSLADAMPLHTTAPVTARDHFVVAFAAEELRARIEEFRDLSISDEEIRRRYFQRTRSARYEVGDTRGWKLAEARRIVAADRDWSQQIIRCLYRPFDWRYVFWHPAMIDWPRADVTRHLIDDRQRDRATEGQSDVSPQSLRLSVSPSLRRCLIARRQQLPTQPCTFFWMSDGLALDGVIRSDNRGSESLFPLYVTDEGGDRTANFAPSFADGVAGKVGLSWLRVGSGDLIKSFGPEDLFAYIYALFHSPRYRERYVDDLRRDFPRVIAPSSASVFTRLSRLGRELVNLHSLRTVAPVLSTQYSVGSKGCQATVPSRVTELDEAEGATAIDNFRAGGYVALRKWLQPKHRTTADPQYSQIVAALARTVEIMAEVDAAVEQCGGWKSAFGSDTD